jgi:hypothetical protein
MIKAFAALLVALGAGLVVNGVKASESLSSDVSRLMTGSPTDKTLWLLLSGVAASTAGFVMLFQRSHPK